MRRLILWLCILSFSSCLLFAELAGKYTGTWTGGAAEGGIKIALAPAAKAGEWSADVSFTIQDQEIQCKTVSVKVEGAKLEIVYDFNLGSTQARSTLTGQVNGAKLEGKYVTRAPDGSGIDEGTWQASSAK